MPKPKYFYDVLRNSSIQHLSLRHFSVNQTLEVQPDSLHWKLRSLHLGQQLWEAFFVLIRLLRGSSECLRVPGTLLQSVNADSPNVSAFLGHS